MNVDGSGSGRAWLAIMATNGWRWLLPKPEKWQQKWFELLEAWPSVIVGQDDMKQWDGGVMTQGSLHTSILSFVCSRLALWHSTGVSSWIRENSRLNLPPPKNILRCWNWWIPAIPFTFLLIILTQIWKLNVLIEMTHEESSCFLDKEINRK